MVEVLPAPPGGPGPVPSTRTVPRFVPLADKPSQAEKPKCPVCPRKFIVTFLHLLSLPAKVPQQVISLPHTT